MANNPELLQMLLGLQGQIMPNTRAITQDVQYGPQPNLEERGQLAIAKDAHNAAVQGQLPVRQDPVEAETMGPWERLAAALGTGMTTYAAGMGAGQARDFAGEARQRFQSEADRMTAANDRSYQEKLQRVLFDIGQRKEERDLLQGRVDRDEDRRLRESAASAERAYNDRVRKEDRTFQMEMLDKRLAAAQEKANGKGDSDSAKVGPGVGLANLFYRGGVVQDPTSPEGVRVLPSMEQRLRDAGDPSKWSGTVEEMLQEFQMEIDELDLNDKERGKVEAAFLHRLNIARNLVNQEILDNRIDTDGGGTDEDTSYVGPDGKVYRESAFGRIFGGGEPGGIVGDLTPFGVPPVEKRRGRR